MEIENSILSKSELNHRLRSEDNTWLVRVKEYAKQELFDKKLTTGESAWEHAEQIIAILTELNTDGMTKGAAYLFLVDYFLVGEKDFMDQIAQRFGSEITQLLIPLRQLLRLRDITRNQQAKAANQNRDLREFGQQIEVLRKMVLAMASDLRVVILRLASRLQTMRFLAAHKSHQTVQFVQEFARETLDIYAPLANRLGIWQLKWELEDLAFRFIESDTYKQIAHWLDEKRVEREQFIQAAIMRLHKELMQAGIMADVSGRPKHIYSIVNKMRNKGLEFTQLYDIRGLRILCTSVKDCYTVLGLLHHLWKPIAQEFDDYISRPKPNGYQSLHTVLLGEDGRPFEVQIRTHEMHQFAEYGVAAHWRYKEKEGIDATQTKDREYDAKIAWLRQLLHWRNEVADNVVDTHPWIQPLKTTHLDQRIYVLTPQARVIDLPLGSTPVDFAYHLHSDLGHHCRGARVDGVMVPLNTPLKNGQTVEIVATKQGGPSRDWLNPQLGYLQSNRAKTKVRQWFNAIELEETHNQGRTIVEKELQRLGKTAINLEELAQEMGFEKAEDLFVAMGREAVRPRQIAEVLGLVEQVELPNLDKTVLTRSSSRLSIERSGKSGVLVVGVDALMTQLARCCRPAPPDPIVGFVTRGRGVSIHRVGCSNLGAMLQRAPERAIEVTWGQASETLYPVDIVVFAHDRQGLLRDISEVMAREKTNLTGVKTQTENQQARMQFTVEIAHTQHLQKVLSMIREIEGVFAARRK